MSNVTGILLCMSCAEVEDNEDGPPVLLSRINEWLAERGFPRGLRLVKFSGGHKHPQWVVAEGGFNYFPDEDFADFILSLPWVIPEQCILVMNPEHSTPRIYRSDLMMERARDPRQRASYAQPD
jgi:hypothetical protein